MTMIKRIFSIIIICMICSVNYANQATLDVNNILELTLINHSSETLMIQAIATKANVVLKPNKEVWKPRSVMKITCIDKTGNGVQATVRFLDGNRHYVDLIIEVREKRHNGQPKLGMNNAYYKSTVPSKTSNPDRSGRALMYTAAIIELQNK